MMLTNREQLDLVHRIEDEVGHVGDYVYSEGDFHLNESINRIEQMLKKLEISFCDEQTCVVLRDRDTGEKIYKYFEKGDVNGVCYYAAKFYAWNDCDDTYEIEMIKCDGAELEYAGWQPGMLFEFFEVESGKIVYSAEFPQWDH